MSKFPRYKVVLSVLWLIASSTALARDDCTSVDFPPEANSTVIAGRILPEQTLCYQLIADADQEITLQVLEDDNISALLQDPMDPQKFPRVPSDRHVYQVLVKQIKRTVTPQLFRVSVTATP